MQPKRQEGVQVSWFLDSPRYSVVLKRRSFPIPDAKLAYCGVCNLFLHSRCLTDHRHRFHSFNHTCFLCDPINGKLIEGIRIKEHLAEVHSSKGFRTCRCCNYIFKKYSDLIKHCKVLDRTGKLGNQQILAKSQQQPGELKAENFAQEFKEFRARQKARQEAIALITCQSRSERLDKKPSQVWWVFPLPNSRQYVQDIQLPRKVLDDGPENTSQSSFITNQASQAFLNAFSCLWNLAIQFGLTVVSE